MLICEELEAQDAEGLGVLRVGLCGRTFTLTDAEEGLVPETPLHETV
jgi:hypothetical protein